MTDSSLRRFVADNPEDGCDLGLVPSKQKVSIALGVRRGFQ